MTEHEHGAFWSEIGTVAHAIEAVYAPIHINFQILGNQDPHVHVHLVPRYDPDPAPSLPLPSAAWENSIDLSADDMTRQIARLQRSLGKP